MRWRIDFSQENLRSAVDLERNVEGFLEASLRQLDQRGMLLHSSKKLRSRCSASVERWRNSYREYRRIVTDANSNKGDMNLMALWELYRWSAESRSSTATFATCEAPEGELVPGYRQSPFCQYWLVCQLGFDRQWPISALPLDQLRPLPRRPSATPWYLSTAVGSSNGSWRPWESGGETSRAGAQIASEPSFDAFWTRRCGKGSGRALPVAVSAARWIPRNPGLDQSMAEYTKKCPQWDSSCDSQPTWVVWSGLPLMREKNSTRLQQQSDPGVLSAQQWLRSSSCPAT